MKIASYRRANEEETGPLPEPVRIRAEAQDAQIEELTSGFQGRINFQDNFPAQVISYEAQDSETIRLTVKNLKSKPTRLILDWTSHLSPWRHCWRVIDQATIEVMVQWADPPSGRAKLRITVFGD